MSSLNIGSSGTQKPISAITDNFNIIDFNNIHIFHATQPHINNNLKNTGNISLTKKKAPIYF